MLQVPKMRRFLRRAKRAIKKGQPLEYLETHDGINFTQRQLNWREIAYIIEYAYPEMPSRLQSKALDIIVLINRKTNLRYVKLITRLNEGR